MEEQNSVFIDGIPHEAPVLVILVEQDGCPACQEYHPTFVKAATWYAKQGLPIIRLNLSEMGDDVSANAWMNEHRVDSTPTVVVTELYRGEVAKLEGVSSEGETRQLLDVAWSRNRPKPSFW